MDDSAVFAVRAKYADDLEELVQCPVCFERPSGSVPTCRQGHHLCGRCRDALLECPVCRGEFGDARNFVVEELSSKLGDILSSLLEPSPVAVARRSASTQTDAPTHADESVLIVDEHLMRACRIGFCQAQLPAECVYLHVRDYHRANLIVVDVTSSDDSDDHSLSGDDLSIPSDPSGSFRYRWDLAYERDKLLDYAVHAHGLGLFFFSVHVDREGTLQVEFQVAHSDQDVELNYEIDLETPNNVIGVLYNGRVQTCLASAKKFANAHKCNKDFFEYFFEGDGKTPNKQRTLPFTINLDVSPVERPSRGPTPEQLLSSTDG